jgi:hypothetical protein
MADEAAGGPSIREDLDHELAGVQSQIESFFEIDDARRKQREEEEDRRAGGRVVGKVGLPSTGQEDLTPEERAALDALYERSRRLHRLQKWMIDDPN